MKITRMALPFAMIGVLSACGYNTQAVSDFNDGAVGLTKNYSELMENNVKWCYESMIASQLGDPEYTDAKTMKDLIDGTCSDYAAKVKTAEASAIVVNTYAAALSALVGVSPQFLEDDAKNLKDAALTIKNAKGEQKLKKEDLEAFNSLVKTLSEMITTAAIKDKATELMRDNSAAVNRQVDVMISVSKETSSWMTGLTNEVLINNLDFVGNSKANKNTVITEKKGKDKVAKEPVKFTNEQAIPYRYLAYILSKQHPDQEKVDAALRNFETAAISFKAANRDLEKQFTTLSKKDQITSILVLKKNVDVLRESIQTIRK